MESEPKFELFIRVCRRLFLSLRSSLQGMWCGYVGR